MKNIGAFSIAATAGRESGNSRHARAGTREAAGAWAQRPNRSGGTDFPRPWRSALGAAVNHWLWLCCLGYWLSFISPWQTPSSG